MIQGSFLNTGRGEVGYPLRTEYQAITVRATSATRTNATNAPLTPLGWTRAITVLFLAAHSTSGNTVMRSTAATLRRVRPAVVPRAS